MSSESAQPNAATTEAAKPGCRLRNTVLPIIAFAALSIAVVGVTPLAVSFVNRVEEDTEDRLHIVTRALSQSIQQFFYRTEQMPFHASSFASLNVTNLRDPNATQRFLLSLAEQSDACAAVYFGLSDGYYSVIRTAPQRQFCFPPQLLGNEYCCDTDTTTGTCAGSLKDNGYVYDPRVRPWYAQLSRGARWSALYPSFTTPQTISTTAGGPIVVGGTTVGVFAVDITFSSLQKSIAAMALTDSDSAGFVVYEASSSYVVLASFDDRPTRQVVTLRDLANSSVGSNLADMSAEELAANTTTSKTLGAPFYRRFLTVTPLVNITGLDLRVFSVFLEEPVAQPARFSLALSAGLGLGLVVVMSIAVALLAVIVIERPLHLLAERLRSGVLNAMGTDDHGPTQPPLSKPYIAELIEIQDSFDVMTDELRRLRAFVPKSFLIDSMEAFEDDGEPELFNNTFHHNARVNGDEDEASADDAADELEGGAQSPRRASQLSSISSTHTRDGAASPSPTSGGRQAIHVGTAAPLESVGPAAGTDASPSSFSSAATPAVRFSHLTGVVNAKIATKRWLTRSQTTAKTSPAPAAALGRRFHKELKAAGITVATLRLRHVESVLRTARDPKLVSDLLALAASVFEVAATKHGGVIDHYSGDRVTIAFNALRPASGHRRSSIECVLTVSRLLRELSLHKSGRIDVTLNRHTAEWEAKEDPVHAGGKGGDGPSGGDGGRMKPFWRGVSAGVASGAAYVGNVGSDTLTRFAIISDCVDVSAAQELRCRQYEPASMEDPGAQCICSGAYAADINFSVVYQTIDAAKNSHGRAETTIAPMRMLLAKPSGAAQAARDDGNDSEWMYELQRAQEANEFNDVNAAFDAYVVGRSGDAQAALTKAESRSDRGLAHIGIARIRDILASGSS